MANSFSGWTLFPVVLLVYLPWLWLAIRTRDALQFLSQRAMPYTVRTIWLVKSLALIVGAGGVLGVSLQAGLHWLVGLLLSGAVVFLALTEKVEKVVPPIPPQNPSFYHSSWQEYMRLRKRALRSLLGFFILSIAAPVLGAALERQHSHLVQLSFLVLLAVWIFAMVCTLGVTFYTQFSWARWPCPRCGCSFRGLWRLWLPEECVYCGLPRWAEKPVENFEQ